MASPAPSFETGHIRVNDLQLGFVIVRSRRRKRTISFRLDPDNKIHVQVPNRASLSSIHRLLQRRAPWFARKLDERQRLVLHKPSRSATGSSLYLGHSCKLVITRNPNAPRQCRLSPSRFHLNIPAPDLSASELQHEIRLELLLWLKKRARFVFQKRCMIWARRLGVTYKTMLVVNPTTQWGSCNAQNVIRLNWRLIMAPLALLDYVVAHELCHVTHKNHAPQFWRQLQTVMPDYKSRRKQLRILGANLIL